MKKTTLGMVLIALLTAGAAQAEDASAVLTVTGNVTSGEALCAVNVSQDSVSLTANLSDLASQSSAGGTPAASVELSITGDTPCYENLARNKIAYRFRGTADNADGNVLANVDTSAGSARGIGVRLADRDGNTLAINEGTLLAGSTPTRLGFNLVTLNGQEATPGSIHSTLTIDVERL